MSEEESNAEWYGKGEGEKYGGIECQKYYTNNSNYIIIIRIIIIIKVIKINKYLYVYV